MKSDIKVYVKDGNKVTIRGKMYTGGKILFLTEEEYENNRESLQLINQEERNVSNKQDNTDWEVGGDSL